MINLQTLDLVIGLVTVFLAVSLVCSSINEVLASILNLRASTLRTALDDLLGQAMASIVINHPAVPAATSKNGEKSPAYIEPSLFATALLHEILTPSAAGQSEAPLMQQMQTAVTSTTTLLPQSAKKSINAFMQTAAGDYQKLHDQVACWFDAYMDRVSGVYKRRSHLIATVIAFVVVVILNVDTLSVYRSLETQPAVQAAVAKESSVLREQSHLSSQGSSSKLSDAVRAVESNVAALPIPLGWDWKNPFAPNVLQKIVGLLITIVAASFGAPFWFGVLTRLTNIRSAGPKPT